jgi:N-acetylglutamate synthase-like GNAT family acetyltransferase
MDAEETRDEALAGKLAALINMAYAAGEGDLFVAERNRTSAARVAELIRAGGVLVARRDGRIVGCCAMQALGEGTVELGFMSAAESDWGSGAGRALVAAGEAWAVSHGAQTMLMKLLVPRSRDQPLKQRLGEWYERLGYSMERTMPFDEPDLTVPAEFLVFEKQLSGS